MNRKMKILYRAHGLIHALAMEITLELFSIGLVVLYTVIVAALFLGFRSKNIVIQLISQIVGVTLCTIMNILFDLGNNLTDFSANFIDSFRKCCILGNRSVEDRKFFKSTPPLVIDVGKFYKISRNTFPSVMHEIIINALISLLLAIPIPT